MSNKVILGVSLLICAMDVQAQIDESPSDTIMTISLEDIIKNQQNLQSSHQDVEHVTKVWRHGGYFNMSYNNSIITAVDDVPIFNGESYVKQKPEFKSDWGVSLIWGHGYRFHKKAIANIVGINLDYTWMDFNVNHFKAAEINKLYNSSLKVDNYYYMPYSLEKYQASYGMNIGPSLTIAPFTPIGNRGLDYIKIQAYYHIGYRFSAIYMCNDEDMDANTNTSSNSFKDMRNDIKLSYGMGMYTSYGVNLSWHAIGIGYEHSTGNIKYKPSNEENYGSNKIEMEQKTNKIYVNFRF